MEQRRKIEYLCILDFEATCCQGRQPKPQEIIEFPTILLNVETGQVEDEFHCYIRPDVHPTLSDFCTELTGITQRRIDAKGIALREALVLHQQWLTKHNLVAWHQCTPDVSETTNNAKTFLYVTCGDWDLQFCLPRQLKYHGMKPANPFHSWINIKKPFKEMYHAKNRGMKGMLDHMGLELLGRHHSGIDDCRNIVRICQRMMEEGWIPTGPTASLDSMP